MMKAVVVRKAVGPQVLQIESLPIPKPNPGQVLIRVKAFGLNRSEIFTRRGESPDVRFRACSASKCRKAPRYQVKDVLAWLETRRRAVGHEVPRIP